MKYSSLDEEDEEEREAVPAQSPSIVKKPLVQPRRSKPSRPPPPPPSPFRPKVLGETEEEKPASPLPTAEEIPEQPKPSPQMNYRRTGNLEQGKKKRPPPPVPAPFAVTHPSQASKLSAIIQAAKSGDEEVEGKDKVVAPGKKDGVKDSNGGSIQAELDIPRPTTNSPSMEELFKNLQDFEVDSDPSPSSSSQPFPDGDQYEVVHPPPPSPPLRPGSATSGSQEDRVITIKISEFKPDSEEEDEDEDEEEISVEVADGLGEDIANEILRRNSSPQVAQRSLDSSLKRREEERPSSAIPLVSFKPNTAREVSKFPRSEGSSPNLDALQQNGKDSPSPPPFRPTAPPRQRKKEGGGMSPRMMRAAPPPPPKPKVLVSVRTSNSDMNLATSYSSHSSASKLPRSSTSDLHDPSVNSPRGRRS